MLATFDGTWDWTAIGTLALAVVTSVSLAFGWRSLRQSQREVEEAHRPVVVPLSDRRTMDMGSVGETAPAVPLRVLRTLLVPVENVGAGPAIHVEATVRREPDLTAAATIVALAASSRIMLEIECDAGAELTDFCLTLTYEDVAGKVWRTEARYLEEQKRYEAVTISGLGRDRRSGLRGWALGWLRMAPNDPQDGSHEGGDGRAGKEVMRGAESDGSNHRKQLNADEGLN